MNPSTEKAIVQFFETAQQALVRIAESQEALLKLYSEPQQTFQQVSFDSIPVEAQEALLAKAGLGKEELIESILDKDVTTLMTGIEAQLAADAGLEEGEDPEE